MPAVTRHPGQTLRADPARVIARLFLPAVDLPPHVGMQAVVENVLDLDEAEVETAAAAIVDDFGARHTDLPAILREHASTVASRAGGTPPLSPARQVLLGAVFTAEHAVEGAALCNPSVVAHPDQDDLAPGALRVAVSLRGISEGHVSAIEFATAVVGPGPSWTFEPREHPLVPGHSAPDPVPRSHLRSMLDDADGLDLLARAVLEQLPERCTSQDLETVLERQPTDLLIHPDAAATAQLLRRLVSSSYSVGFPAGAGLSRRVLLPSDPQEVQGMEDARFVRFDDDGTVEYRATYTAYDGRGVASRLLTTTDLTTFRSVRLAGPEARNKGMALFPRTVGGRHLALSRSDGARTSLATSEDGLTWDRSALVEEPRSVWQLMRVGNSGSPLETPEGWLVLTHGVGPMRRYAVSALLLDLDDPTRVLRKLERPFLVPQEEEREGYVPNVVFTCGAIIHDATLWVPYGIGDARVSVASVPLGELLEEMRPVA